ncbi:MAG: CehA/McbA family metallohydrolase [Armatimonadetes bacterium]|nr:CehA/McbA family metallohydrolase [Armatimonadota bacterium]
MRSKTSSSVYLILAFTLLVATTALPHEVGKLRNPQMPVPPEGTAQCVVATARDLPGGARAEGKPGDYVLRNHDATFVVAAPRMTGGYSRYGGRVLDAVLNEPGHDEDLLGEIFLASGDERNLFNLRAWRAVKAEIVSAGGRGRPAHLRIHAVDDRFPIVDTTIRFPSVSQGLQVTIDYILQPDSPTLEMVCTLKNGTERAKVYSLFWGQILGDGLETYVTPWGSIGYAFQKAAGPPLLGLVQTLQAQIPMVAALGSRVGYGFIVQQEAFTQLLNASNIYLMSIGRAMNLAAGESAQIRLAIAVSDGDMEPLRAEMRRLRREQEPASTVAGRVVTAGNRPVPDARVYLIQRGEGDGQMHTATRTDRRGRFEAKVPPGEYRAVVFADGYAPADVLLGESPDITLQPPARLQIAVRDERGSLLPCALVFERLSGAIPNSERVRYGEQGDYGRFDRVYFSLSGNETIPVEPGRYRLTLTRGFEYEIAQREVDLQPGGRVVWRATLARTARLPGYLSGDFHVHAIPSPDSSDPLADKVKAFVAVGVQILTSTDHDVLTDYQPVILALGAQRWITSLVGCEITPNFGLGHFNAYPQRYDPSKPNNGAIEWYDLNAEQIFAAARANNDGDTIVQVNHPRSPGMGYFNWVGLNPADGTMTRPEEFSPNFDTIEVYNGIDSTQLEQTLPDWFYFLNTGRRYVAVGVTDSHHAYRLEPGFPRTYLYFGHEDVRRVTPADVVRAIRSGNVLVCGGPLIEFTAEGQPMGSTVVARGGVVQLQIRLAAPSWVRVSRVKVYVNGSVAQELPVEHPQGKPLDWRQSVPLRVERDCWVVVLAEGEGFTALYPGVRPTSLTNPVYVDVDGNGWQPPGQVR